MVSKIVIAKEFCKSYECNFYQQSGVVDFERAVILEQQDWEYL